MPLDSSQPVIETTAGRPRFVSDRPFQLESEEAYNPWVRAIGVGVVGTALYATHRTMLATVPEYAPTLQSWAQKFENQTPFHIGRTFAFTERLSSYTTPEELKFTRSMLTNLDGSLNIVGETFQRQFQAAGVDFDVLQQVTEDNPLLFKGRRRAGSAYMKLVGRDGIDFETRFTPSEGRLAGTASRLGQDLREPPFHCSTNPNFRERMWENFQSYRSSQRVTNASPWREAAKDASDPKFRPFHSRAHVQGNLGEEAAQTARNVWSRFQVESLEAVERPQRLFAEAGFGLKAGTWNKTFHLPFAGEGGIVNQMLTRRVLPIALAATAAGCLDYKLGHPSDKVIDLGLKANVLRADLTDMLPGGRKVTDFYENTVPGPQYGPLALPAAGAFAGGLLHYSRVLRGQFATEDLRKAGSRLLPDVKALRTWAGTAARSWHPSKAWLRSGKVWAHPAEERQLVWWQRCPSCLECLVLARLATSCAMSIPDWTRFQSEVDAGGSWDQPPLKARASRHGGLTGASCTRAARKTSRCSDRKRRSGSTTRSCTPSAG